MLLRFSIKYDPKRLAPLQSIFFSFLHRVSFGNNTTHNSDRKKEQVFFSKQFFYTVLVSVSNTVHNSDQLENLKKVRNFVLKKILKNEHRYHLKNVLLDDILNFYPQTWKVEPG